MFYCYSLHKEQAALNLRRYLSDYRLTKIMSSQKGNTKRSRHQKHQNSHSFKNNRNDSSAQQKKINSLQVKGVCQHCKAKIEWKIKYKKYKPLTVPRRCSKCGEKSVKRAYYSLCNPCAVEEELCAMCCKKEPIVDEHEEEILPTDSIEKEMKYLSDKERREFLQKNLKEMTCRRKENVENEDSEDDGKSDEDSSSDDNLELHLKDSKTSDQLTNTLCKLTMKEDGRQNEKDVTLT